MMMGIGFELSWYVIFTFNFFIAFCGAEWFFAVLDYIDECFAAAGGYVVIDFVTSNYKSIKMGGVTAINHRPIKPLRWLMYGRDEFLFDYYIKYERQVEVHLWRALAEIERAHRKLDQLDLNEYRLLRLGSWGNEGFTRIDLYRKYAMVHFAYYGWAGTVIYTLEFLPKSYYFMKYFSKPASIQYGIVESYHYFWAVYVPNCISAFRYTVWPLLYREMDDEWFRFQEEKMFIIEGNWELFRDYELPWRIYQFKGFAYVFSYITGMRLVYDTVTNIPWFIIHLPENTVWFSKTTWAVLVWIYHHA